LNASQTLRVTPRTNLFRIAPVQSGMSETRLVSAARHGFSLHGEINSSDASVRVLKSFGSAAPVAANAGHALKDRVSSPYVSLVCIVLFTYFGVLVLQIIYKSLN
jgi:hypothetical protein